MQVPQFYIVLLLIFMILIPVFFTRSFIKRVSGVYFLVLIFTGLLDSQVLKINGISNEFVFVSFLIPTIVVFIYTYVYLKAKLKV